MSKSFFQSLSAGPDAVHSLIVESRSIQPATTPFQAKLSPPGSKSLTNRAVVLAALADGPCSLSNVLFADDTKVMIDGLRELGFRLDVTESAHTVIVHGLGGEIPAHSANIFCGNSGTTIRFLSALCSLGSGTFNFDGVPRMRQRPIGPLVELLKNLGVRSEYSAMPGYPPIRISPRGLGGGIARYGAEQSSQFLSALIMVAPYARHEVQIDLHGVQTSWPYVAMTMQLMDHFGTTCELIRDPSTGEPKQLIVPRERYRKTDHAIEPDASNATYFLAAAAIHPGASVTIEHLGNHSLQGDVGFAGILKKMGATIEVRPNSITVTGTDELFGIDVDLSGMPDTAQTLAVVALIAEGETIIRGLHTLRVKETDRLAALSTELQKLGASVDMTMDTLTIRPPASGKITPASIATYDDHRMAMSFAIAATRVPGIAILNPDCVNKTYPGFYSDLERTIRSQS